MLVNSFSNNQTISIGNQDFDEYPKTTSKFWMKIDEMKKMNNHNPLFIKNIDYLKNSLEISAWKRSRGDGNCYFRAVITSYLEKICKPYSPISLLQNFERIIKSLNLADSTIEYQDSVSHISSVISTYLSKKLENDHLGVFTSALSSMQDSEFDLDLVRVARLIAYTELINSKEDPEYFVFFIDGIDSIVYDMLEMGKEGGDFSLIFLPKGLNAQVVQYMFLDTENRSVQCFPEKSNEDSVIISLIRRAAHYDILADKQEIELDQCVIEQGTYNFTLDWGFYTRILQAIEKKKLRIEEINNLLN